MDDWSSCFSDIPGAEDVATIKCFEAIFSNVVFSIAGIAAIVFFIMLVVGGFRYLTSVGNPKTTEAAKGTITAAFLGIILLIVGYLILKLLSAFTGLTLTGFTILTF